DMRSVMFTVVSYYMAVTAMFFCFLLTTETNSRMAIIRNAYVVAAVIASILGILGYFDVAGLADQFAHIGRANSTFKDPNVFAPFLIPPFTFLVQDLLLARSRRPFLAAMAILVISLGLFLAFSRGAWGNVVASSILLVMFTLLLSPNAALRRRIIVLSI